MEIVISNLESESQIYIGDAETYLEMNNYDSTIEEVLNQLQSGSDIEIYETDSGEKYIVEVLDR